ncbi:unnamed protein product [Dovyalis caffra]|uniref:Methyltransferase type 11 domain-containing protein n=1 Tax=Dovyalis caffra TaxID=77055 RepID=A0AAV1RGY4_9ROSI|nr:unnamed protein product [Dovyalis caffra]
MARCAAASTDGTDTREVNQGIAQFYDQSTGVWEDIWGDHIHYGFCDPVSGTDSDHRAAQIRRIQEALSFAGVSEDPGKRLKNALDVGCGIGGTTKYIARKHGAKCIGINLSPIQIQRANALAAAEGLADKPFSDGQFDLVLSVECGEYIPDKRKFAAELATLNELDPLTNMLSGSVENLSFSLDIKAADWTQYIAPFLPLLFRSALTWKGLSSLLPSLLRGGKLSLHC